MQSIREFSPPVALAVPKGSTRRLPTRGLCLDRYSPQTCTGQRMAHVARKEGGETDSASNARLEKSQVGVSDRPWQERCSPNRLLEGADGILTGPKHIDSFFKENETFYP